MSKSSQHTAAKKKPGLIAQFREWKNKPREKMPPRRKVFLVLAILLGLLAFTEVLGTDQKGWWFLCFTVAVAFFLLWFPALDEDEKKRMAKVEQAKKAKAENAARTSTTPSPAGKPSGPNAAGSKNNRKKFKN